jgi:iron complex outermembrane receptor protein
MQTDALDEVIVTARKVPENVQQVPISVQVLSGEFLQSGAMSDLYQLQFNVPGLVMTNLGLFGAALSLRGVSDQGGTGQAVAAHLDGVYLGDPNLAITRTFDLERIEVLKGPQGTLYGRNSTGGSINFITKAPEDERGAGLEAAYGTFSTARVQGHVNMPFGKAAFRLAFIGSTGDGYIRNSLDGRRFASSDFWGLRGSLRVNVSDRLRVDVMAQHVEDTGASGELWVPPPRFMANPSDIRLATVPLANPYLHTYTDNGSVTVGYDLGGATLRSITGYAFNEVQNLDDCSGVPFLRGCVRGVSPAKYRQWSEEIQLASRDGAAIKWLVGGNYFDATGWSHFYQNTQQSPVPTFDTFSNTEEKASAIFGQATLPLARGWSATGGARWSHESRSVSDVGTGTRDNATLTAAAHDWDGTSWLFGVNYAIGADVFAYASVATGYKSGGVTTTRLPNGDFNTFEPENLTAYEVGVKSQWLNRRLTLNAAAFRYDFNNMQIASLYVTNGEVLSVVDNAAKAELYGVDAAGVFHVTDRLTLSAGAVWMPKRQFVNFQSSSTGANLSGNDLSRAPEWTASSAIDYRMPLRGAGDLSARLEYNYRSSFFFSKENDPLLAQASFGLLNVFLRFEPTGRKWYAFASGRNLTNQDYFNQILVQASPGYPSTYEIGFGRHF